MSCRYHITHVVLIGSEDGCTEGDKDTLGAVDGDTVKDGKEEGECEGDNDGRTVTVGLMVAL